MKLKKSNVYFIIIAIASIILILIAYLGVFEQQELLGYDWLMRSRPKQIESKDIVIVEIADDTLKSLGQWPLPRNYHAAIIKALSDFGASQIIFDILFTEPAETDDVLADAMRESGRVYLPVAFRVKEKTGSNEAIEVLGGVTEKLKSQAAGIGHINVFVDPDGKVRRLPFWVKNGQESVFSLGLLAAVKKTGRSLNKKAAFAKGCNWWINYPGSWVSTFRHFSYLDVLKAYAAKQNGTSVFLDTSAFKNKICFVGLTAVGTTDLKATPLDRLYPMVGAQASICDSVLRGSFIQRLSWVYRFLISILTFILCLFICLKFAPVMAFGLCSILGLVYTGAAWVFFSYYGIFADLFLPIAAICFVYTASLLYKFFVERQKRRILEKELEIASSIQNSFLPVALESFSGVEIRTFIKPAKFVAGDFYDVIVLNDSALGLFIGDVSGKGVSAALIMAQAISLLRVVAQKNLDPGQVLTELNRMLFQILKGRFVTGQYVVIHTKENFWQGACAGHNPLILFSRNDDQISELLPASGPPLGLVDKVVYKTIQNNFNSGQKVFMYTDGWIEARSPRGEEFGVSRLKQVLSENRIDNIDEAFEKIKTKLSEFEGRYSQHDDITSVFLEMNPK